MIRKATKYDKTQIIEMMKMFRSESGIEQYQSLDNESYWNMLLDNIFAGQGIIFIEEDVGLIIGLITPTIWDNTVNAMYELAWYVKPKYRKGTAGYKLLKAYMDFAKQIKDMGRIRFFTLSKLPNTPDLDYARLGFVKTDENWMQ